MRNGTQDIDIIESSSPGQFEIPETIQLPLNHLVRFAMENRLNEKYGINFEENQIRFIKLRGSWILIYRNSYFALPEELAQKMELKHARNNPFLEHLRNESIRYKLRYRDKVIFIYSVNIPLANIIKDKSNAEVLRLL